ncbi:unnamed protein product [Calicophoron daubneyi]|uniref:Bcl-2 Bcl-2 homology region 1-3 domain-containing protein n=1 Tax=Calicophoron daubneyi TaxID=300641 RepID=A0AAV2SWL3_CALDB
MHRKTQGVIYESIARILEEHDINIEKIPVSDEIKRIANELVDLSKNSRHLYKELIVCESNTNKDMEDAAHRLFGDGINWEKIALFLHFAASCYMAYTRGDIVMFVRTVASYFERFHIQEWVENQGGWEALLKANSTAIALGALGAVCLGALIIGGVMYNRRRRK